MPPNSGDDSTHHRGLVGEIRNAQVTGEMLPGERGEIVFRNVTHTVDLRAMQ
ncbi:hypothetical protein D3C83_152310 [compost metagenome]